MKERQSLYKSPDNVGNLNNMRLKDKWCDVTIKVNNRKEFRAHKLVLAANLKYFEAMLSNDSFQESKEGVVTMESVEVAELIESFISFAYTGEFLITESTALNSLKLANYLSEDGIKKACIEFLKKHLKAEDACQIYLFADSIDCVSLKNVAKSSITTNFDVYSSTADYLGFDCESLLVILSDVKAQTCNLQKNFFEGIMRWISHDANNRKIHMHSLLSCINLNKLTTEYLMSYLGNLVDRNDECDIIKNVVCCYHTVKIQQKKEEQVLLAVGNIDEEFHFQFYDFIGKKWSQLHKIPGADRYICSEAAVLNNKLYFITENSENYNLEEFDPMAGRSTTLISSSSILSGAAMCASSGCLYFCGGSTEDLSRSNQILSYDPQKNTFDTLTPMGMKIYDAAAIFYQGYTFMFWEDVASHLLNRWNLIASMNEVRDRFSVIAHDGTLLAIGGDEQNIIEVYDPRKDQWQVDTEMSAGLKIRYPVAGMISSICVIDAK